MQAPDGEQRHTEVSVGTESASHLAIPVPRSSRRRARGFRSYRMPLRMRMKFHESNQTAQGGAQLGLQAGLQAQSRAVRRAVRNLRADCLQSSALWGEAIHQYSCCLHSLNDLELDSRSAWSRPHAQLPRARLPTHPRLASQFRMASTASGWVLPAERTNGK